MGALEVLDSAFVDERYARPDHRMRRFIGRLCRVLLVLVLCAAAYIWRYQPLAAGATFGARIEPAPADAPADPGSTRLPYSPGGTVDLVFSLDNDGWVPLRVTGLPDALSDIAFSYEVRQMPRGATGYDETRASAFRAFTLRAGESRVLDLRYTLKDCGPPLSWVSQVVRRQPVRYDYARRLHRSADVALLQPLVITGMPPCPSG